MKAKILILPIARKMNETAALLTHVTPEMAHQWDQEETRLREKSESELAQWLDEGYQIADAQRYDDNQVVAMIYTLSKWEFSTQFEKEDAQGSIGQIGVIGY